MWHCLEAARFSRNEISELFSQARLYRERLKRGETLSELKGKTVATLFFENSTRTRLSFETAARRLGGASLGVAVAQSSVQKGETLSDTARNIVALGVDALVVRHASAGSPAYLAERVGLPVINAGDGFHEHPTQALLDAFTMTERLGDLNGRRVVILGDIAHSRVARSNISLLHRLGAKVVVCGPTTLLPPRPETLGVEVGCFPEEVLRGADVVMPLRMQQERHQGLQVPSLAEYARFWGLTSARVALLPEHAVILHPGPINRGVEIDSDVADSPRSLILDQVANGVLIRMAVLARALRHTEGANA